jgi:hypothetical protein
MRAAVNFFSKKFKRMSISRYLAHQVLGQGNVARALTFMKVRSTPNHESFFTLTHRRLKYE